MQDLPATALAPISRRVAARVVDSLIVAAVALWPLLAFSDIDLDEGVFATPGWVTILGWAVGVAYEVGLVVRTGQTVGKRALGIRVADAVTGGVPNLDQAGRRALPALLSIVPVLGVLAPLLWVPALWHPRRQGLHDALAGTIVVGVSPPASS